MARPEHEDFDWRNSGKLHRVEVGVPVYTQQTLPTIRRMLHERFLDLHWDGSACGILNVHDLLSPLFLSLLLEALLVFGGLLALTSDDKAIVAR